MKRLAVLGHPVAHSRSPAMHSAALTELGLADELSYEAIALTSDEFEPRVQGMATEGFVGANVTVPHKKRALALADASTVTASEIGAANTLSFVAGKIHADNTDAQGLLDALPDSPGGKQVLVLGAGGAARAVVWALVRQDAEVDVWNRTPLKAESLCEKLGGNPVEEFDLGDYDLLINSTSIGLHGGENALVELPLKASQLEARHTVVDLAYGEGGSRLIAAAQAAGAATIDGLEVLVRQGALSLEIWTGKPAPLDVMRAAARS